MIYELMDALCYIKVLEMFLILCSGLFETPTYEAYWMKPESFDEILVCGMTMLYDHMPNVVYKALNSMIQHSSTQTNVAI